MFTLSRIIESWRDADDFKRGVYPISRAWHLLKYPQYFFIAGFGFVFALGFHSSVYYFAVCAADLVASRFAFEYYLRRWWR